MVDVREHRRRPADLLDPHGSMTVHNVSSVLRLLAGCENQDPAAPNPFDISLRVRLDHPKSYEIMSQVHLKILVWCAQQALTRDLHWLA